MVKKYFVALVPVRRCTAWAWRCRSSRGGRPIRERGPGGRSRTSVSRCPSGSRQSCPWDPSWRRDPWGIRRWNCLWQSGKWGTRQPGSKFLKFSFFRRLGICSWGNTHSWKLQITVAVTRALYYILRHYFFYQVEHFFNNLIRLERLHSSRDLISATNKMTKCCYYCKLWQVLKHSTATKRWILISSL